MGLGLGELVWNGSRKEGVRREMGWVKDGVGWGGIRILRCRFKTPSNCLAEAGKQMVIVHQPDRDQPPDVLICSRHLSREVCGESAHQ